MTGVTDRAAQRALIERYVRERPGALLFDASSLPPPPQGWRRTVFLESHGWDKDADRNTWEANQMEPLPFRAMKSYPYAEGERYPDTPELRKYRAEWLTRVITDETRASVPASAQ